MIAAVHKFELIHPVAPGGREQRVRLQKGATPLSVVYARGILRLYALVDIEETDTVERTIVLLLTGHRIDDATLRSRLSDATSLGTIVTESNVVHAWVLP